MRSRSQFKFRFDSEESARSLYKVLKPEVKSDYRAQTTLSIKDTTVLLSLKAEDRNSLRSAINSYGRWIRLYEEIGGIK